MTKIKDFQINPEKYILIKTEIFEAFNERYPQNPEELARLIQKHPEAILCSAEGTEDEFFVMMLKDRNSRSGLISYARQAALYGQRKLASAVQELAERAGSLSPFQKTPD